MLLLEDKVKFQNLGLAVIDEQHRFGENSVLNYGKKTLFHHMF
jgi:ATP-dependent DNA helicase RecG